jgi:4-amino-4-deoxy-L-arabinose transferase-like glycosyltransferase
MPVPCASGIDVPTAPRGMRYNRPALTTESETGEAQEVAPDVAETGAQGQSPPAIAGGAHGPTSMRSLGVVFAIALVLRLAHALAMTDSPYFANPVVDAGEYDTIGWGLAHGQGHPDRVYWHPPGYPYFLGWIWWIAGDSYLAPRIAQAILGALSAVLVAWIGRQVFGRVVGIAAGVATACYGMLIYFDGELLPPSLTVFLTLAAIALALVAKEQRRRWLWLMSGIAGGLATLVVATSMVVPLVVAAWSRRKAAWVLLGLALAVAPATLHNYVSGHELVLVSKNGGINFWIGNNPDYDKTVNIRADAEWHRLVNEPARAGVLGAAANSSYFVHKSLAWVRRAPGAFLLLQLHKLRLLVAGHEIYRNQAIYPARLTSPVLRVLLWKIPGLAFPFGLLFPLAGLGLVVAARRARLLAWLVACLAATIVAFFVTSRYRVTMVPFLCIFAACGVRWFVVDANRWQRLGAGVAVLGLYLLSNLGQGPMDLAMNADAEYSLGIRMGERGHLRAATALFESAVARRPQYAEAWLNLATCYDELGRPDDAQRAMNMAFAADPAGTLRNIQSYLRAGRPELAERLAAYLHRAAARPR